MKATPFSGAFKKIVNEDGSISEEASVSKDENEGNLRKKVLAEDDGQHDEKDDMDHKMKPKGDKAKIADLKRSLGQTVEEENDDHLKQHPPIPRRDGGSRQAEAGTDEAEANDDDAEDADDEKPKPRKPQEEADAVEQATRESISSLIEVKDTEFSKKYARGIALLKAGQSKGNTNLRPKTEEEQAAEEADKKKAAMNKYSSVPRLRGTVIPVKSEEAARLKKANADLKDDDLKDAEKGLQDISDGRIQKTEEKKYANEPRPITSVLETPVRWRSDPTKHHVDEYLMQEERRHKGDHEPHTEDAFQMGGSVALTRDRRGVGIPLTSTGVKAKQDLKKYEEKVKMERRPGSKGQPPRPEKADRRVRTREERAEAQWRRQKTFAVPHDGATHAYCEDCKDKRGYSHYWVLPDPRNFVCPGCTGFVKFYSEAGYPQWQGGPEGGIKTSKGWLTISTFKTGMYSPEAPGSQASHSGGASSSGSRKAEAGSWPRKTSSEPWPAWSEVENLGADIRPASGGTSNRGAASSRSRSMGRGTPAGTERFGFEDDRSASLGRKS